MRACRQSMHISLHGDSCAFLDMYYVTAHMSGHVHTQMWLVVVPLRSNLYFVLSVGVVGTLIETSGAAGDGCSGRKLLFMGR